MKKTMLMLIFLLAIGFQSSYAEIDRTDYKVVSTTVREDGGFWGAIWHFFGGGYAYAEKVSYPDDDNKVIFVNTHCKDAGSLDCPAKLREIPVPSGFNHDAFYNRDREVGTHLENAETTGIIKSIIQTPNGKKYSFNTEWTAINSRNNTITTTLQEIPELGE